jgi:hypothetical protein
MTTHHKTDAQRAHVYACKREAEALRRKADHARKMGSDSRADSFLRKARQYERRAAVRT